MNPGTRITDSIELLAPIAEGAMGKVWVAYHHRLKTRVAVKFVHERLAEGNAEAAARFEREAETAAQIKSPHVVQTFDCGVTQDGQPYIVMELLEGQSLGDRIRRQGPLGWAEMAVVVAQVARALTKAHELGIVHRDIKPDNIFLCGSDDGLCCKILDFGIAKQTRLPAMGGLTTDGKIVGTPEFMSPEMVLEDRTVDLRADLWALGVVTYAAITGQLPYSGKTLGQLCLNLVNKRPVAPSQIRRDLPAGADAWFERALHRDPSRRFASARELGVTFAAVLGGPIPGAEITGPTLAVDGDSKPRNRGPTLALDGDSERQFASAATTSFVPKALRTKRRAKAVLAAAAVAAVAVAVVVLARGPSAPPRAPARIVASAHSATTAAQPSATAQSADASDPAPSAAAMAQPTAKASVAPVRNDPAVRPAARAPSAPRKPAAGDMRDPANMGF